jgi:hypothetical protein
LCLTALPSRSQAECATCQRQPGASDASQTLSVVIDRPASSIFNQQNELIAHGATVAVGELDAQHDAQLRIRLVSQSLDGLTAGGVRARLRAAGAAVVILPCDTNSEYRLAAEVASSGILTLAPCDPDPREGQRYPNFWAVGMGANAEAAAIAAFIARQGARYVFVVNTTGGPRSLGPVTHYFTEVAPAQHEKIVGSASVALGSSNFASLANAIKAEKHRPAIFTALPPPYVNRLVAGLAADGVRLPVFGTAAMDTPLTLKADPPNGTFFGSYGFLRQDAAARQFSAAYVAQFHAQVVGGFPGLGLETMRLLEEVVQKAGSVTPAAMEHVLVGGLTLSGVGLADRTYLPEGDHTPLTEVGISTVESDSILPVVGSVPVDVPLP